MVCEQNHKKYEIDSEMEVARKYVCNILFIEEDLEKK